MNTDGMARPAPPENIRLRVGVGDEFYLDHTLEYQGLVDGIHVWKVQAPEGVRLTPYVTLHVDVLPAGTTVYVAGVTSDQQG